MIMILYVRIDGEFLNDRFLDEVHTGTGQG